ncbi:hypothetical protein H5410_020996, partial [Solanum commersonii]
VPDIPGVEVSANSDMPPATIGDDTMEDVDVDSGAETNKEQGIIFVCGHLSTFVELELAFEASIVNLSIFDNGIRIEEQSKDTNRQNGTKQTEEIKKDKLGDHQEHLVNHRVARWTA